MKLKVDVWTRASATVEVDVPEEDIAAVAEDLGILPQDVTIGDLLDLVYEKIVHPSICAQCSGWGKPHSLELGSEWEIDGEYKESEPAHYRPVRLAE